MRVTNTMMVNTLLRNLNNNMNRLNESQEQLSSQRRINRPSDDPVGIIDSLRLRTGLTEMDQYKTNAEDAKAWLESTDAALNESGDIIHRIRELTVQAGNDSLPQLARDAIAKEVSQLKQQLIQIGNTSYAGRYIFSGTATHTASFNAAGTFQGNTNSMQYEIGVGVTIPINVDGSQAFGNLLTPVAGVLDNIINDLNMANTTNLTTVDLTSLDAVMDQQLQVRSDIGARVNRLDFAVSRMDTLKVNMTDLLSKTEDADTTQVITLLKQQESVYNASLSAGARIVQPSLMDFLR